jgi:hypothetical protein
MSTAPVPNEPVLQAPRGLTAAWLAALAIGAGLSLWLGWPTEQPLQPQLQLEFWRGTPLEIEDMRTRDDALLRAMQQPALVQVEREWRLGVERWWADGRRLGEEAAASDPEFTKRKADLQSLAAGVVAKAGPDGLRWIAVRHGRSVRERFEHGLRAAQARREGIAAYVRHRPMSAEVAELQRTAGPLTEALAAAGLGRFLRDGQLDPAAARVVEAYAARQLLAFASQAPGPPVDLPTDVTMLLTRFEVEAHPGLSLPQKFAKLEQVSREDASYPAAFVSAVLLARAGRCAQAVPLFQMAVKEDQERERAAVNAKWCELQRRPQAPPVP